MGRCEYVMAKDSVNNKFEIRQVNEPCGNGEFSCTKSLTVIFPNVTIQLLRGSVVVNDSQIDLPASYGGKFFLLSYLICGLMQFHVPVIYILNLVEYIWPVQRHILSFARAFILKRNLMIMCVWNGICNRIISYESCFPYS